MKHLPEDKTKAAYQIAEEVLTIHNARDIDSRKKAREIYNLALDADVFDNMLFLFPEYEKFGPYLSWAANQDDSIIVRPPGKQGYFLSAMQEGLVQADEEQSTSLTAPKQAKKEREKEAVLYPLIKEWMLGHEYRVKDTSQSKSHGKWGNPDVTGLKVSEFIGSREFEITTIEAKIDRTSWEYNIFEAVSHRRFANRVYFAFAHPATLANQIPPDIRYYCEIYSLGLLLIVLDDDLFDRFVDGGVSMISLEDDYEIKEVHPAPFNAVRIKYQKKFLKSVGITETRDIYTWGESIIG